MHQYQHVWVLISRHSDADHVLSLMFRIYVSAMYAGVLDLKRVNPSLKVILSVGGWNMGSAPFNYVSDSGARRNVFAVNALAFLNKYGFDGLDLDWEYPDAAHKKKHWQLLKVIGVRDVCHFCKARWLFICGSIV